MKFPGSRLLHQWDLSVHRLSLDDLVRSCRETGLTGLAEVRLPGAVGLIFYYAGVEVNAHYREGAVAISGRTALERLQARGGGPVGTILVFELPLGMAHPLRGRAERRCGSPMISTSCCAACRRPSTRVRSRSRTGRARR